MGSKNEKLYGLLGKNIQYSLSPVMHNAAFKHFGIDARYELFDIDEDEVDKFLNERAMKGEVAGFNVTVPYKLKVYNHINKMIERTVADSANFFGAVNTVKVEGERLIAYNTDGYGFITSLDESGIDYKGREVFILGAGGAGRTLCLELGSMKKEGPSKIYVYDIDYNRVDCLIRTVDSKGEDLPVEILEGTFDNVASCSLIINATPIGTKQGEKSPIPLDLLKEGMQVYDLVYAAETELIKDAKEKGLRTSTGLSMLINQGAKAFTIWTGEGFTETKHVMEKAANAKLGVM